MQLTFGGCIKHDIETDDSLDDSDTESEESFSPLDDNTSALLESVRELKETVKALMQENKNLKKKLKKRRKKSRSTKSKVVSDIKDICVDLIINRVSYELYRLHGLINHQINWVMEQFTQLTPITVG